MLHISVFEKALQLISEQINKDGKITLAQFRDLIGTSRKYAMPILEYCDNAGYTKKIDDYRVKGPKLA